MVEAGQVEWPLNRLVSMPILHKLSFNQIEAVSEVTSLRSLKKPTKINVSKLAIPQALLNKYPIMYKHAFFSQKPISFLMVLMVYSFASDFSKFSESNI